MLTFLSMACHKPSRNDFAKVAFIAADSIFFFHGSWVVAIAFKLLATNAADVLLHSMSLFCLQKLQAIRSLGHCMHMHGQCRTFAI